MRGTVALVTGASRGGGRGIATALADDVDHLVLAARSADAPVAAGMSGTLAEVAAELTGRRARVHPVGVDLTDPDGLHQLVERIGELGGCDLLVANAAYNPAGPFLGRSTGSFAAAMALNVTVPAFLCHALLPGMFERGRGRIVAVGSAAAVTDFGPQVAYAASKAALERFVTALSPELAGTGVQACCIRVDEALRSETLARMYPDADPGTGGCTPAEFGVAVAAVAARSDLAGRILTFADLRGLGALPDIARGTR